MENQPGIPEQKLQSKDKYPDDESSLTAEANSSILLRKTEWTDKALVHAKKEALDMRTEQANQIIASRIRQEEKVRASALDLDSKEGEIKELTHQQNQLLKHGKLVGEGSIERVKQDVDTKLVTAKAQREQLVHSLKANQAALAKLQVGEQGAKQAVQQAEDEYARVLRDDFQPPATKSAKPEVKPVSSASPVNPLDENAALLQRLERSKQN